MKLSDKRQQTMMSKKFFSMLLGGTLTMLVVSLLLMSDSIIAGAVIGPDAVAGVTLVTPIYSMAAFFGSIFSLGVPLLYSKEMGKFKYENSYLLYKTTTRKHHQPTGMMLSDGVCSWELYSK